MNRWNQEHEKYGGEYGWNEPPLWDELQEHRGLSPNEQQFASEYPSGRWVRAEYPPEPSSPVRPPGTQETTLYSYPESSEKYYVTSVDLHEEQEAKIYELLEMLNYTEREVEDALIRYDWDIDLAYLDLVYKRYDRESI